jgi:hypothetical protein
MALSTRKPAPPGWRWIFIAEYRHWRSGKIMRAQDYGYQAWCFLVRG